MSIEATVAELTKAVLDLSAKLDVNSGHLERVIAGQEAAMAKLEGKPAATTRTRPKKEEPAAAAAEEPKTEPKKVGSNPVTSNIPQTEADMKAYVAAWTGATDDADERASRVGFLKALADHFGGKGYAALVQSDDTAKQAVFFIERKKLGLSVDLNAEYDFDGEPGQGGGEPAAAAEEDDFG